MISSITPIDYKPLLEVTGKSPLNRAENAREEFLMLFLQEIIKSDSTFAPEQEDGLFNNQTQGIQKDLFTQALLKQIVQNPDDGLSSSFYGSVQQ